MSRQTSNRPGLTGAERVSPPFERARDDHAPERAAHRGSAMVSRDRPHPAPRPSPEWAYAAEREEFYAAMARDDDEARRQSFKISRRFEQAGRRTRPITR